MTAASALPRPHVPASTIRLARALVEDARRRGRRESASIEAVARTPLPDDHED
ncbi:hypothetical protein K8W59_18620 [Nocardioides rotundus]|uniref:hypothetical protein n=1 Tax=Nocardioides rotundus TaxID=1774216 RepID=UPI001CBCC8A5|nr:hypothetical protein [Nocardioides rotundus]UAL29727.1 hypothetical protein K8W59_18620 [Nocardioides rotundus]